MISQNLYLKKTANNFIRMNSFSVHTRIKIIVPFSPIRYFPSPIRITGKRCEQQHEFTIFTT
jgi:hypothetical protein